MATRKKKKKKKQLAAPISHTNLDRRCSPWKLVPVSLMEGDLFLDLGRLEQ
jgi:hypothetical protein